MPIAEWENLTALITPEGTLTLNDATNPDGVYITVKDGAQSGTDIRSTGDPVPQGFGTIWHRGFANGYVLSVPIQYWVIQGGNRVPACETTTPTAQEMDDLLMRHYRSIVAGGGRILYNPAGQPTRLADDLFAIAKPVLTEDQVNTNTVIQFGSELPYLIDFDQTVTTLDSGTPTGTLTNDGSSPFFPVFKVYGPIDDFVIANAANDMQIVYDSALPGGLPIDSGHYVEIDTFRNTVYLDGDGPSRKAAIYIPTSDFFPLEVGANAITISGSGTGPPPTVDILWQAAWF
jgi:hypothetical protein